MTFVLLIALSHFSIRVIEGQMYEPLRETQNVDKMVDNTNEKTAFQYVKSFK